MPVPSRPPSSPSARSIRVREADPVADKAAILDVLARNLPVASSSERHDWLYLSNPAGRCRVWLAEDEQTGAAIGTSAGHPKLLRVRGETVTALDLSDFAIDRAYRSLGPALKLLRATLEPMKRGEFAFSYDHPSEAMLAIYRRMGATSVSRRRRWVRLIDATPTLRRRWGPGMKAEVVGRAGRYALRAMSLVSGARARLQERRANMRLEVSLLAGPCGEEFDRFERDGRAKLPAVHVVRSSAYLRWRYQQHTMALHEILCARRGERLEGFLVMRPEQRNPTITTIVDLVTTGEPAVATLLVEEAVRLATARESTAVWATVLAESPVEKVFPANGFSPREARMGVCIYAPALAPELGSTLMDPMQWWMLEGDQDV